MAMNKKEQQAMSIDYLTQRIGEVIDEGDGFWRSCSGCQESADGAISPTEYPFSEIFRCHPGAGCGECGGIGVIWDDTDYEDMARACKTEDRQITDAPAITREEREAIRSLNPDSLLDAIDPSAQYLRRAAKKIEAALTAAEEEIAALRRERGVLRKVYDVGREVRGIQNYKFFHAITAARATLGEKE